MVLGPVFCVANKISDAVRRAPQIFLQCRQKVGLEMRPGPSQLIFGHSPTSSAPRTPRFDGSAASVPCPSGGAKLWCEQVGLKRSWNCQTLFCLVVLPHCGPPGNLPSPWPPGGHIPMRQSPPVTTGGQTAEIFDCGCALPSSKMVPEWPCGSPVGPSSGGGGDRTPWAPRPLFAGNPYPDPSPVLHPLAPRPSRPPHHTSQVWVLARLALDWLADRAKGAPDGYAQPDGGLGPVSRQPTDNVPLRRWGLGCGTLLGRGRGSSL